jgi:FkbM family methyltransferase
MTVLDCGAAEGIFALSVESRAARVYAFEPKPEFLSALSATFDDSAVVEPVPKALSDREGTGSLGSEALWSHVVVGDGDVRITTVDAWARGRQVDFIKADVEGMEYALLRGAEETILRYKPRIAITTYHIGNDATRMVELLRHIVPSYQVRTKGTSYNARVRRPIMLHAWV